MKTITDIKPQQNNPKRCNIYLDNSFYCGLELETVARHRLKIGQLISPFKLDEIQLDSERTHALDKALCFISRSKKTKKQVEEHLKKKGYTEQTILAVMEKLEDYRFVDDEDYAFSYVKSYSKNKGKRLLAMELKAKGVSPLDMQEALSSLGDEEENALSVAEKYLKNKQKDRQTLQKCYKYLISKGFSYETAKSVLDKVKEDADDLF